MYLWHMHSEILKGFYQSDIYVIAACRTAARITSILALNRHITEEAENFSYSFLVGEDPLDPEFEPKRSILLTNFALETQNLTKVNSGCIIALKS